MNKRWMGWIAGLTALLMGCDTGTTTTPTTDEEPVSYGEIQEEGDMMGMTAAHNAARDKQGLAPSPGTRGLRPLRMNGPSTWRQPMDA